MGRFGTYTFVNGEWRAGRTIAPQMLLIEVHDSDVATVQFAPVTGKAEGCVYLGFHPRDYFEDPSAGIPIDSAVEVKALAAWAKQVVGSAPRTRILKTLVAEEGAEDPTFPFVEDAVAAMAEELGLPALVFDDLD